MIRVMVVDDEKYMLQSIVNILQQCGVFVAAEFTRSTDALNWVKDNYKTVDAVFLDVSMPIINGFALADVVLSLDDKMPVVFVTAYDSYAVMAFEKDAIDYVLKPTSVERISLTLKRIEALMQLRAEKADKAEKKPLDNLRLRDLKRDELWEKKRIRSAMLKKLSGAKHADEVLLFNAGNWKWMKKDFISCFNKDKFDKYVQVLVGDEVYETTENLADFKECFREKNWVNCFRATFVNVNQVTKLEKTPGGEGGWLCLKNTDKKIPVSRGYLDDVFVRLNSDEHDANQ
ncbi:MAG: LytTR family DNA-binding domain-containing protein [Negativicutes bacterium]